MILEALAAGNFALGVYDAYITQRRIKLFGVNFELNKLIKSVSTHLGPELAAIIGVLGPCVGWTYIFTYFNAAIPLALMVGFGLKRFEMQLSSRAYEKAALEMQKMIDEFRASNTATLPVGELTPLDARENSNVNTK